ncbi:MAG: hypothetical protein IJT79_05255 [Ruminococcus sp.]|nr:hypothetical protein [Ruminococcus sp.]
MEEKSYYVPDVIFELIPIKNLVSNQRYQRNLSQSHIARAVAAFDPRQINPVKVSRRDGINYVFNGQHTIEIVALASGSRETPVWCMVFEDLDYKEEADIFANQQKYVKPLQPYEVFMANVEAGNDDQLIILSLVESYGLSLGTQKGPCVICAVSSVEEIYLKYGYHTLNRVLRLIIATWEGDLNSFSSNMLKGVAKLVVAYGDALNDEVFKEKLGCMSIKQLTRTAKERRPGSMGFAEAMVNEYNGRKKNVANMLPLNKLHTRTSPIFSDLESDSSEETEEPQALI